MLSLAIKEIVEHLLTFPVDFLPCILILHGEKSNLPQITFFYKLVAFVS